MCFLLITRDTYSFFTLLIEKNDVINRENMIFFEILTIYFLSIILNL